LTSITGHARTQTRKIRTAPKGDSGAKAPKPEALVKNEGKGHLKSFDKAPAEPLGVPWSGTGSKGLEQEGRGASLAVDGAKAPTAGDAASECAGETERGREGERERSRASERELQRWVYICIYIVCMYVYYVFIYIYICTYTYMYMYI
jgi:hypothetical protein